MRIILSRKGFDSSWGGHPSPILPDGCLLSIPIPSDDNITYDDLRSSNNISYYDIMSQLYPKIKTEKGWLKLTNQSQCHLDPDLNEHVIDREKDWGALFGQIGIAQSHLANNGIGEGDLFLFFGLFRKTILHGNKHCFDPNSSPIHIIFGFLQIAMKHYVSASSTIQKWMEYHPHSRNVFGVSRNNTIYEARKAFSLNPEFPGAGVFSFNESLILTKKGHNTSQWTLPDFSRNVSITYHNKSKKYGWKENYFQSASRGQEFIIDQNDEVTKWARELVECNAKKL